MDSANLQKGIDTIISSDKSAADKMTAIFGRKGILTDALRALKDAPAEKKAELGKSLNILKKTTEERLKGLAGDTESTIVDLSAPPLPTHTGSLHPVTLTVRRMVDIFVQFGFEVIEGNEVVSDWENFESLNFDADHPARDTQMSFLMKDLPNLLLRTQTSSMQVPSMKLRQPPIRFIVPGKTFRREADATHSFMFHQLEGVIVDECATFADLKGLLQHFVATFFGKEVKMRFRPHFFPFTEPSAEVDILWKRVDGSERWLEILGCGCIHPSVLMNAGIDPKRYQGLAFGFGIERPLMLRHGINDIRAIYQNSESNLSQFEGIL